MKPTDEMIEHYLDRTHRHIATVQLNIIYLVSQMGMPAYLDRLFHARLLQHDLSKFQEPEFTAYVFTTWSYRCRDRGEPFEVPQDIQGMMHEATLHHVRTNAHHPEYWDPDATINQQDRDKPPERPVNATKMDAVSLAEMACDWHAVSLERGNSALDWARSNIGTRWVFADTQQNQIYRFLQVLTQQRISCHDR